MHITLSPQRSSATLALARDGDTLTINGATFDFSDLGDGDLLPREAVDCEALASDVERVDGALRLTLRLPHGPAAPQERRFPEPIIDPPDGRIALPQHEEIDHAED